MRENEFNTRVYRAKDALQKLKTELDRRTHEAKQQIRNEMDVQFNAVMDEITEATRLQEAEQKLIEAETIESISNDPRIGQIYCQWKAAYSFSTVRELSGLTGICEVYTDEHKSLKARRYGSGCAGKLVIRYLMKSGERGKLYEAFHFGEPPHGWYPIGETPDQHR